jgi:hypothetical protein
MAMATATYTWTLTAYEQQGMLWLQWSTNAPFRAQQGQISIYNGTSWPTNPQDDRKAWTWDNIPNTPWNTGQIWGQDWHCAYIAQASPNGPYEYNVQLITTGGSNSDSKRSE